MTINLIAIGFDWRQAFDFPAGFIEAGNQVRAEFLQYASDRLALATATTRIEDDRLFVELSEEQTAALAGIFKPAGASVVTNFVIDRGADEIAVGVIVTVPVVLLPTRPRA